MHELTFFTWLAAAHRDWIAHHQRGGHHCQPPQPGPPPPQPWPPPTQPWPSIHAVAIPAGWAVTGAATAVGAAAIAAAAGPPPHHGVVYFGRILMAALLRLAGLACTWLACLTMSNAECARILPSAPCSAIRSR